MKPFNEFITTSRLATVNLESQGQHPNAKNLLDAIVSKNERGVFYGNSKGVVTDKMSPEISRSEKRIIRAFLELNDSFLNSRFLLKSTNDPGMSQDMPSVYQEPNENCSQKDPKIEEATEMENDAAYSDYWSNSIHHGGITTVSSQDPPLAWGRFWHVALRMNCWCRGLLQGQSFASSGCERCLFQDEDHSGSRPLSFLARTKCVPGRLGGGSGVALI